MAERSPNPADMWRRRRSLGDLNSLDIVQGIAAQLEDNEWIVRLVVEALQGQPDLSPEIVQSIDAQLEVRDRLVRQAVVEVLQGRPDISSEILQGIAAWLHQGFESKTTKGPPAPHNDISAVSYREKSPIGRVGKVNISSTGRAMPLLCEPAESTEEASGVFSPYDALKDFLKDAVDSEVDDRLSSHEDDNLDAEHANGGFLDVPEGADARERPGISWLCYLLAREDNADSVPTKDGASRCRTPPTTSLGSSQ